MDTHEAIINPIMGEKPAMLGDYCLMIPNQPDIQNIKELIDFKKRKSRKLLMSTLFLGGTDTSPSIIGPFIGAPYAAILMEILISWGIRQVVFWGWCGAISKHVHTGDVIIPEKAFIDEGTSKNYSVDDTNVVLPSEPIQAGLKSVCAQNKIKYHEGPIWTTDAIYRETKEKVLKYQKLDVLAVEMEASALFSVGAFRGIDVGCILVVSDELSSLKWEHGFSKQNFIHCRERIARILCSFWTEMND